tara:strand:+ start:30672 stop:30845 length:174 start_codon:yes stop_codon:yes gene_type:complete
MIVRVLRRFFVPMLTTVLLILRLLLFLLLFPRWQVVVNLIVILVCKFVYTFKSQFLQ